ncbi:MFS transporter [Achromobacter seleniivolatilans]|uniref:MFS transporter n=1 Tax=Achromobacter seleniivolatilans TaxID=3047478 RepID=A0ABY9M4F2_9BURK|nr:MFS transporter [Achromobacter sp. R39]WMD21876.1 MFS transporter [Achromobacter sp. R39]
MNAAHERRGALALAAICLSALMLGLEISSVPPILSTIEQVMGASFRQLQWVMAAYTIAMTTILMATGTLADRYGRKRIFMAGIAAFGVTSLVCGLTENIQVLIAARFLQGLSAAMMLICQVAILSSQFRDSAKRSSAFAWWGVIFGVGLGFGPIVGGAILAFASWKWVFLVHGALSVITLALAYSAVEESRDPHAKHLDVAGILTLSVGVFCLVLFVTQGPVLGFSSLSALGIIGLSVASFIGFAVAEMTSARPMIDFSAFKIRNFSGALAGSVGMNLSFWPFIVYLPIYFQVALGYDNVQTGLAVLAYTLPTLFMPAVAERLSARYHPGFVIPAGLSGIGTGFVLMALGSLSTQPGWLMMPGCIVAGIGLGLTNTPVANTITAALPGERAGMASGADMSARMTSLAFSIALMGLVLVEGAMAFLTHSLNVPSGPGLRLFAEKIAAGDINVVVQNAALLAHLASPADALKAALVHGFGWVMAYGAGSAFLLALISLLIFSPRKAMATTCGATACQVSPPA